MRFPILKTDNCGRTPIPGQQGHGGRIIQLLFRYSYYTTKSIKKEAEMPVFSRLHGVLNALGCSISRPDISQSNCCHVS